MLFIKSTKFIFLHTPWVHTSHFQNSWSRRWAKTQGEKNKTKVKKNIYSLALLYSVQKVKDFQSLLQDYGMNSLRK